MSFFGGGTDYPIWYRKNGGEVLSTTIDKYCYITCRYLPPFFLHKYHLRWSVTESVSRIEDIKHPSIRECINYLKINQGLSITHDGDLPARSGMGSSSSFTVGMLNVLYALVGQNRSKNQLLQDSLTVEQDLLGEAVGSQDQTAAVFGGLNHIEFGQDGSIVVSAIDLNENVKTELESHLLLFFTGLQRTASNVVSTYVDELEKKSNLLNQMRSMVRESVSILEKEQHISLFGQLLNDAWQIKRSLSTSISSDYIDSLYESVMEAGALGGKITGAGAGGFLLVFATPDKHSSIRKKLSKLLHVPFSFENLGSHILDVKQFTGSNRAYS